MHEMGLRPSTPYRKSAGIVGEVLEELPPARRRGGLRRAGRAWRRTSSCATRWSTARATSAPSTATRRRRCATPRRASRRSPKRCWRDIDKDTVDFGPNYDDAAARSRRCCPARLPNLLLNGAAGIAVGMATNIPPHNLDEICDALILPDRQPGGDASKSCSRSSRGRTSRPAASSYGREGIKQAYATGHGRVVMRAKALHRGGARGGRYQIIVTETAVPGEQGDA